MKLLVIASMLILFPKLCQAEKSSVYLNGNTLLEHCNGDAKKRVLCMGYIMAISDVLSMNQINGYVACTPDDATSGQMADIVNSYLKSNPKERHLGASGLVAAALADAFPC